MGLKHIAVLLVALQVTAFARDISYESSYESVALGDAESSEGSSEELPLGYEPYDSSKGETVDQWFDRMNADVAPSFYPESMKADAYAQLKAQQLPEPTAADLKKIDKELNDGELKRTNELRALHGAPPLEYDPKIAVYAQNYADYSAYQQSQGYPFDHNPDTKARGLGENMAGDVANPPNYNGGSTDMWYFGEIGQWKKNGEKPSIKGVQPIATGHFTQVVWTGTKKMGCGRACQTANDCTVICNYFPAGNMGVGDANGNEDKAATLQKYRQNVNMKMSQHSEMKQKKYKSQISELTKNSIQAMGAK